MNLKQRLNAFCDEILKEATSNPDFSARLEAALGGFATKEKKGTGRSNKRSPAAIDPFVELEQGEAHLRHRLLELSIEQLRDILSQYGMDRAKLAMKWKETGRIADLIVKSVMTRSTKGDAFREPQSSLPKPTEGAVEIKSEDKSVK